jgi:hypothetical protein
VDEHPPYWEVHDSLGATVSIDSVLFESLTKRWKNRKFVNLHHHRVHLRDGNKYVTDWDSQAATLEPVTTEHSYENRVQASTAIVNFKEVDPKKWDLYEHSKIHEFYHQRSILGQGGATHVQAEQRLDYFNATLGSAKQVRMYILVFKDKPIDAAMDQEAFWKGGHKNELVTCVGVSPDYEVKWAYVFSWSKTEDLKIEARDFLAQQTKLDLAAYVEWLGPEVQAKFVRFNWHTFDYLTVEPPGWVIALAFFLTIAVNIGLSIWTVMNQYDNEIMLNNRPSILCKKCRERIFTDELHECVGSNRYNFSSFRRFS